MATTLAEQSYSKIAPLLCSTFLADFPQLMPFDAFAVFGNGGYESLGFTKLQEISPTVKGSRGGLGLFQWTGPRRREFEAYCKRNGKDPSDIWANYAFMFVELHSTEKRAIPALMNAGGAGMDSLRAKVIAFEDTYERAGVKAYDRRVKWARVVEDAYNAAGPHGRAGLPGGRDILLTEGEAASNASRRETSAGTAGGLTGVGGGAVVAPGADTLADWLLIGGVGLAVAALVVLLGVRAWRNHTKARDLKVAAAYVGAQ